MQATPHQLCEFDQKHLTSCEIGTYEGLVPVSLHIVPCLSVTLDTHTVKDTTCFICIMRLHGISCG